MQFSVNEAHNSAEIDNITHNTLEVFQLSTQP